MGGAQSVSQDGEAEQLLAKSMIRGHAFTGDIDELAIYQRLTSIVCFCLEDEKEPLIEVLQAS